MPHNKDLPSPSIFPHKMEAQLRFNDIDILGHLNNTVYFSLYDMGKARYLEACGLRNSGESRPDTVIADIHCTYVKPIHFDDKIYVLTRCREIGDKSYTLEQMLVDDKDEVRSVCRTVMVYFDPSTGHAVEIPQTHREKLLNYEGERN